MPRSESRYVCGTCGAWSLRWEGQCRSCAGWNTLVETPVERMPESSRRRRMEPPAVERLDRLGGGNETARLVLGVSELDRVLGGGLVAGSLVLLGGEPGIGKSTLLLALGGALARAAGGHSILYASGEESPAQVRLRAGRLGLAAGPAAERVSIVSETAVDAVIAAAEAVRPTLLLVDSVQTLTAGELEGPAGSVGQVRAAATELQLYAKRSGVPVILVGHVTKDGSLAGPKTLEHLVDVVLTLEGERFSGLRLLRASKNRFGSTEEVGVFEMTGAGLHEVSEPAGAFLGSSSLAAPGVAVAATLEGSRPLLIELQALVAGQAQGAPRRTAAGVDQQRLALLIAVLARRAGINLTRHDVYASVVGGLSVVGPQIDLPLALALASSLRDRPLRAGTVACGEVGLTGELRPANGLARRLREAARLGFRRAIVPAGGDPTRRSGTAELSSGALAGDGLELVPVSTLREALAAALEPARPGSERSSVEPAAAAATETAVLGSPTR